MNAWRPKDSRVTALLQCAIDYDSWSGDEDGEEDHIKEILNSLRIERHVLDEIREWWFYQENPYLNVIRTSVQDFLKAQGKSKKIIDATVLQFDSDIFCNDFLIMIDVRFFGEAEDEPGCIGFTGEIEFSNFIDDGVDEEVVFPLLASYFQSDAIDIVSKGFFESEVGKQALNRIAVATTAD
jgi:hypothetical protein